MNPLSTWLGTGAALATAGAFAVDAVRAAVVRRKLAVRVNRAPVSSPLPALDGELRDAACGALLCAALGDAAARRVRRIPLALARHLELDVDQLSNRPWRPRHFGVRVQLMLASARAVDRGGTFNERRYRLELAFLARYALDAPPTLLRTLRRIRHSDSGRSVASDSPHAHALLIAVPVGVVWHDRPRRAADVASRLIRHTHASSEVESAAALVASAAAHMVQLRANPRRMRLAARRHWIERVVDAVGKPDSPAAIALLPVADLASAPLDDVIERIEPSHDVLSVLETAFQIALHRGVDIGGALTDVLPLGRFAPDVAGLAMSLMGARMGASLASEPLEHLWQHLTHRYEAELQGEKLAFARAPHDGGIEADDRGVTDPAVDSTVDD